VLRLNLDENETQLYAKKICCKVGSFPFKYLGVPVHCEKLRRDDIQLIVDKILSRISDWNDRLLSYGARLALLKACFASIPVYLMSIIKFPKWAIKAINSQMVNFFRNDQEISHKYHLVDFRYLNQRKDCGGMGIPDLRDLNLCLLAS
jgi:hypothetical protein